MLLHHHSPSERRLKGFLDLPAELRNNVYAFILSHGPRCLIPRLRRTCRQIRNELTPMFFAHYRFRLNGTRFATLLHHSSAKELSFLADVVITDKDLLRWLMMRGVGQDVGFLGEGGELLEYIRQEISTAVMQYGKGAVDVSVVKVRLPPQDISWSRPLLKHYIWDEILGSNCHQWRDIKVSKVKEWRIVYEPEGRWRLERQ